MAKPLDRRTQAARQPDYRRLYTRMDRLENRLEDIIDHVYKLINELSNRVSALEKNQDVARTHDDG